MNAEDITWKLAQLASLPFQERYVIGGTADEYVLDTELLENVDGLKYLVRRPENRVVVTEDQMAALEELFFYIENNSGEVLSGKSREECASLIRESTVWKELRAKAKYALQLFGISVDQMSAEDVDRLGR